MSSLKPLTTQPLPLECSICKEEIKDDLLALNHKVNKFVHHFHHECAKEWLKEHPTCPICSVEADPSQVIPIMIASNTLSLKYASSVFSEALKHHNEDILELLIGQIASQPELGPELLFQVADGNDAMFNRIKPLCDQTLDRTHVALAYHAVLKKELKELRRIVENSPNQHGVCASLFNISVNLFLNNSLNFDEICFIAESFCKKLFAPDVYPMIFILLTREHVQLVEVILKNASFEPEQVTEVETEVSKIKAFHHTQKLIKEGNLAPIKIIIETGHLNARASEILSVALNSLDEFPDFLCEFFSVNAEPFISFAPLAAFENKKLKLCLQLLQRGTERHITAEKLYLRALEAEMDDEMTEFCKKLVPNFIFPNVGYVIMKTIEKENLELCEIFLKTFKVSPSDRYEVFRLACKKNNTPVVQNFLKEFKIDFVEIDNKSNTTFSYLGSSVESFYHFIEREKNLELAVIFFKTQSVKASAELLGMFQENLSEVFSCIPEWLRERVLMVAALDRPSVLKRLKAPLNDEFANDALIHFLLNNSKFIPHEILDHPGLRKDIIKQAIDLAKENNNSYVHSELLSKLPDLERILYELSANCMIS